MTDTIKQVAEALKAARMAKIERPLSECYTDMAQAAIDVLRPKVKPLEWSEWKNTWCETLDRQYQIHRQCLGGYSVIYQGHQLDPTFSTVAHAKRFTHMLNEVSNRDY